MAPALTQDSQPELLLPYFSTPPYTPSPPSSVGGTTTNAVSSVLHHYHHYHSNNITIRGGCDDVTSDTTNDHNLHHSVSCSNMEDGPSGGLDDQHLHHHHQTTLHRRENSIKGGEAVIILEQQEDESSTRHNKAHHRHHHLDRGDDNDKFNLEDLDEESTRSITFNQPTPPHSTDSSAPLSPLPGVRNTHPHGEPSPECVAEEELSFHGNNKSPAHLITDNKPSPSFLSISSQTPGNQQAETEANHQNLSEGDRSLGLYNSTEETTRLTSPHSLLQTPIPATVNTFDSTAAHDEQPRGSTQVTATSTAPSVTVHSSEDLSLCGSTPRSTATLAPTPHLVGSHSNASEVVGEEKLEVGELVRPLPGSTTATTIVVSPPATSLSSTFEGGSSAANLVVATMGCTLPQVETKVAVRCLAPQPNDTPPPAAYLPRMNSATLSSSITDWNNDNLIPILPDEFFTSLNHLVASNPGLLDQLNPSGSIMPVVPSTATCTTTSSFMSAASAGCTSRVPMLHEAPSLTPSSQSIPPSSSVTGGELSRGLTPEQQASAMVSSLTMRQLRLQKRQAQVLRRLRRFTGRGLAAGISHQLRELVKNVPGLVLAVKQDQGLASSTGEEEVATVSGLQNQHHTPRDAVSASSPPVVLQPPRYDTTALKSMSTAKLITYVRRMETRSCASSTTGSSPLNTNSCSSSKSSSDRVTSQRLQGNDVLSGHSEKQTCFSARVRSELSSGAREMSAAARLHVEHDSDATESSSGGESCDEKDGFDDDLHTDSKPITSRALYRHSAERAWIAARWTWLEAQLADVECKIHQHNRAQMRLRHLSRSTASKTELSCHHYHHHQASSSSPAGSATPISSAGINPAMLSRPSYTCLTRSTQHHLNNNTASLHQSIATHNANTTTCNGSTLSINTKNSSGSSTTTGGSGVGGCSHSSFLPGAADVPSPSVTTGVLPTLSSCCGDSGSARTSGYRWHRKRRWIRVGNVFERGDACSGEPGSTTQDLKDNITRIKTSPYSSSTLSTTNTNDNIFVHNKNHFTNIKTDDRGGTQFNNNNISSGVDKKVGLVDVVVKQPTFAVSCECVPPYSCVLCTRLPSNGAIVSSALPVDRKSLVNNSSNSSNSKNIGNKLFPHHLPSPLKIKQPPSLAAPSSNAAFASSPRYYPHSLSPHQPPLSPLKSSTPSWSAQETPTNTKPPQLFARQQRVALPTSTGGRGTESLCKSAWFPRVPSSSRTCLNTQPRHVPLPERLGQHDFAYHPVLSHPSEILQSTRLESVLKSKAWMKKLSSLQNPSSLLSQRQASSVSSSQQSRLSAHTTTRGSPYKETVPLSGRVGSSNSAAAGASASSSHYSLASTDASTRVAPPLGDAPDLLGAHHHRSSSSHSKKKKKNKNRDRSREGRRKDKKKKSFKRKEKEAKKGRLTLRLRKSSVTGEMVPTGEAPCSLDKTHHYLIEGSSNIDSQHCSVRSSARGVSGQPIPPLLSLCDGDSSSIYSSSRASSPSLPPHSPAATLSDHGHHHQRGSTAYSAAQPAGDVKGAPSSGGFYGSNFNNNKYNKVSFHDKPSKTVTYSDKVMRNSGGGTPMDIDGGSGVSESSSSLAAAGGATSVGSAAYSARRTSMYATSGSCSSSGGSSAGTGSGYASSVVAAGNQFPLTPAAADAMTFKKKQGTASYDIDNIVIPYNMATVTRVEPIEYKEIVTPKWSEMDEPQPLDVRDPVDPTEEDVSEAAVLARHQRSEELERLRFAAHMSTGGTRHGGNARTRQRNAMGTVVATGGTSSAGTNTPDNPLSPHVDVAELASPMVSPPSTPQPQSEDSNQSSSSGAPKQLPSFGLSGGNALEAAFPEESSSVEGDRAETSKSAPTTETEATTVSVADVLGEQMNAANAYTAETAATSASLTASQKSSRSHQTTTVKTVTHSSPIVISSPFLANLCSNAETATSPTTGDGLIDVQDNTIISASGNVVDVAAEQIISSASSFPSNDAAAYKAAAPNSNSGGAASRRLRSNSAGLRPRSGSNGIAANQPAEDEHNSREVSPFPMRQFPLGESQYDSMLRENSEASVHPLPATEHRTLLHSLDYEHFGETSSEDEDTSDAALLGDGENDEADSGAFLGAVGDSGAATPRSTKRKLSDAGWYVPTPPDSKRKPKRHSSPALRHSSSSSTAAVLTNHNIKTGASAAVTGNLEHAGRNNKKIEDTHPRLTQHSLAEHPEKISTAARRNVPVTISLKDINSMSHSKLVTDNSEGRCSPQSEATDSAAEDDTTGDLLSSDGGRPDWTISATADTAGHCIMQVLRH